MAHIPHIEALAPGSTGNQRPEALIRKLVMVIVRMIKLVVMIIKLGVMRIKLVRKMIKYQFT